MIGFAHLRAASTLLMALFCVALVSACSEMGEGDNAPTIFDSAEEQAARAQRRQASPGAAIYGKPYEFVDAVIDGATSTPGGTHPPRIIFEDRLVKGTDGCLSFSAMTGIFSPSGYEFSFLDSGPLFGTSESAQRQCTEPGRERWRAMSALENRVWSLSIDANGVLVLSDHDGAPYSFRLRPAT